jgi:hypothetical protein
MKGFIKDMLKVLGFISLPILLFIGMGYCESKRDPYEIGTHLDYTIQCDNGFVYKILDNRRGVIQILNSDGKPLRCNQKRY